MKVRNLLAIAAVALFATSAAFAQTPVNYGAVTCTPTALPSNGLCATSAATKLVAVYPEGLTVTLPPEIDFFITPNTMVQGIPDLSINVTWNLASLSYQTIYVDAYFTDSTVAMQAQDPSQGVNIAPSNMLGAANGLNPVPFTQTAVAPDPLLQYNPTGASNMIEVLNMPLSSTTMTGSTNPSVRMYIDNTSTSTLAGNINPTQFTWYGYVYVMAAAV